MTTRKTNLKFTIALIGFLALGSILKAQHVGHIKTIDLVESMPSKKKADENLKLEEQKLKAELDKRKKAIQTKYADAQEKAPTYSPVQLQEIQKELEGMQQNLLEFQEEAASNLARMQEEIYQPIFMELKSAINKVAEKKGLDYVLDSSIETVVLYSNGVDILADVKKELGL